MEDNLKHNKYKISGEVYFLILTHDPTLLFIKCLHFIDKPDNG